MSETYSIEKIYIDLFEEFTSTGIIGKEFQIGDSRCLIIIEQFATENGQRKMNMKNYSTNPIKKLTINAKEAERKSAYYQEGHQKKKKRRRRR